MKGDVAKGLYLERQIGHRQHNAKEKNNDPKIQPPFAILHGWNLRVNIAQSAIKPDADD